MSDELYQSAVDEMERLRQWVLCPEHGPRCGGDECCCLDLHQPKLATDRRPTATEAD